MYVRFFKRAIDVVVALPALLVLALPLLVVAAIVRTTMGRPVLFRQKRIGRGNKPFSLIKFRSMTDERDARGIYLPDDRRTTRFGRFIRRTSIDELPELFNILRGDMSLIGPRPLPVRYLERYTDEQRRRHEVRPGLSCPSIIGGRNALSWEEQFAGDVWYVDHVSLLTDLKCVLHTVRIVLSGRGATAADGQCRGEFIGTADVHSLRHDEEGNHMKIDSRG